MHSATILFYAMLPLLPLLLCILVTGAKWYSPPVLLLGLIFFGSSVRYMFLGMNDIPTEETYLVGIADPDFLNGILIAQLGLLGFAIGYAFARPQKAERIFTRGKQLTAVAKWPIWTFGYYALIILGIGLTLAHLYFLGILTDLLSGKIVIRRFLLLEDGERTSLSFLGIGRDILMVAVLARIAFVRRADWLNVSLFLFILGAFFFSGGRSAVLSPLLALFIITTVLKGRMGASIWNFRVAILAIGLFGITVMTIARNTGENALPSNQSLSATLTEGALKAGSDFYNRPYFMGYDKLSLIHQHATEGREGHLWGESFTLVLIAPIPRILWPDKPSVRVGQYVGTDIYQRKNKSGVPPSIIGELFLNFGWVGVFLGMALLGNFCRRLFNRAVADAEQSIEGALYYTIFAISVIFIMFIADFTGGMIFYLSLLSVGFIAIKHFRREAYLRKEKPENTPLNSAQYTQMLKPKSATIE